MKVSVIKKIGRRQKGFTLVEVLVAVAITGILATGIAVSISQTLGISASSNAKMQAIKQIEVAIDRIRTDVQMAQEISTSDLNDPQVFLVLKWVQWDNTINEVKYSLDSSSHQMIRLPSTGTLNAVTKNMQSVQVVKLAGGNLSITLVATVEGYGSATESRTFEVQPRSSS